MKFYEELQELPARTGDYVYQIEQEPLNVDSLTKLFAETGLSLIKYQEMKVLDYQSIFYKRLFPLPSKDPYN